MGFAKWTIDEEFNSTVQQLAWIVLPIQDDPRPPLTEELLPLTWPIEVGALQGAGKGSPNGREILGVSRQTWGVKTHDLWGFMMYLFMEFPCFFWLWRSITSFKVMRVVPGGGRVGAAAGPIGGGPWAIFQVLNWLCVYVIMYLCVGNCCYINDHKLLLFCITI